MDIEMRSVDLARALGPGLAMGHCHIAAEGDEVAVTTYTFVSRTTTRWPAAVAQPGSISVDSRALRASGFQDRPAVTLRRAGSEVAVSEYIRLPLHDRTEFLTFPELTSAEVLTRDNALLRRWLNMALRTQHADPASAHILLTTLPEGLSGRLVGWGGETQVVLGTGDFVFGRDVFLPVREMRGLNWLLRYSPTVTWGLQDDVLLVEGLYTRSHIRLLEPPALDWWRVMRATDALPGYTANLRAHHLHRAIRAMGRGVLDLVLEGDGLWIVEEGDDYTLPFPAQVRAQVQQTALARARVRSTLLEPAARYFDDEMVTLHATAEPRLTLRTARDWISLRGIYV